MSVEAKNYLNILKVQEKNCYDHGDFCSHVCVVKNTNGAVENVIINSKDIYKHMGNQSPFHIIKKHEVC